MLGWVVVGLGFWQFLGGTPILAPRKHFKNLKKIESPHNPLQQSTFISESGKIIKLGIFFKNIYTWIYQDLGHFDWKDMSPDDKTDIK